MSSLDISHELQNIISDNISGSAELRQKLHNYFEKNRREVNPGLISLLQNKFSDFQTITHYLNSLNQFYKNNSLDDFFVAKNSELKNELNLLIENSLAELRNYNSFLTISNSGTIKRVITKLSEIRNELHITVSEGRPMKEGVILAEELANLDISVKLITEAQIFNEVSQCDCAIIGADKILPNGNVINKVGSNLLAIACKHFSKPLYVIAQKNKFSRDNKYNRKEMHRDEIAKDVNQIIEITNYYFEEIPKELITKIITD